MDTSINFLFTSSGSVTSTFGNLIWDSRYDWFHSMFHYLAWIINVDASVGFKAKMGHFQAIRLLISHLHLSPWSSALSSTPVVSLRPLFSIPAPQKLYSLVPPSLKPYNTRTKAPVSHLRLTPNGKFVSSFISLYL